MDVDKNPQKSTRIRIKYPNGLEIEIEGDREFVEKEKRQMLSLISNGFEKNNDNNIIKSLSNIIDFKENTPYIKLKLPQLDEKMAILIILFAFEKILSNPQPKALSISKALRMSGYYLKRLDTAVFELIKDGSIKAFGIKRNRSYSLTDKGKAKAEIKIANIIQKQL
ncbi:MAG: hypothetical protein ACP5IO_05220 [Elusimicrobiales bacterium]